MVGMPRAKLYNVVAFEWVRRGVFDLVGGESSIWRLVSVTLDCPVFWQIGLMEQLLIVILRMDLLV